MNCPKCGVDVVEEAVFCHGCGHRIELPEDQAFESGVASEEVSPKDEVNSEEVAPKEKLQEVAKSLQSVPDEPEKELWHGGYSSKAMISAWFFSGLVSIALIVLAIWSWHPYVSWPALAVVVVLWIYQLAVMFYRKANVRYKLTTLRFMHESGILRRVTDRIETIDMTDITFEQGLLERFVGVGTIHITSSDRSHPQLLMPGIENVKQISGLIDEIRCNERRRRGLRIDQI